ncbi:uncharacterized protein PG986_006087, partial [Apiospora aurea]
MSSLEYHDNTFDLVHSRLLAGGINAGRWPSYLRDLYRVLVPGGWVQMVEIYFNAQSDGGHLSDRKPVQGRETNTYSHIDHALSHWSRHYLSAMEQAGKDPRAGLKLEHWMREAGFTRMEMREVTLPMCGWSHGKNLHVDPGTSLMRQQQTKGTLASALPIRRMLAGFYPLLLCTLVRPYKRQARQEAASLGLK